VLDSKQPALSSLEDLDELQDGIDEETDFQGQISPVNKEEEEEASGSRFSMNAFMEQHSNYFRSEKA